MRLSELLFLALFAFPPVFSWNRYRKKDAALHPSKSESLGIWLCTLAMIALFLLTVQANMFF